MTLEEFAHQFSLDHPDYEKYYIAIMPTEEGYLLEVEVEPRAVIGGCYATQTEDLARTRKMADKLEEELRPYGWLVYRDRGEWEDSDAED